MSGEISMVGSFLLALFLAGYLGQRYLPPPRPRVLGVDLGTTFCSAALFWPGTGTVEVLRDEAGRTSMPSTVWFGPRGVLLAGHGAPEQAERDPRNTLYDTKRFIGRTFDAEGLRQESQRYPFKVVLNNGSAEFVITPNDSGSTPFHAVTPEFVASRLLLRMRKMAEDRLGGPVSQAVIAVPAEFNQRQRNCTVAAAKLAGLEILRIINEPTAAALAYGLHRVEGVSHVVVVDLGGGTLDVSLLSKQGGLFFTRATAGNNHLGGQDFSQRLLGYIIKQIEEEFRFPPTAEEDIQRLRQTVEEAKLNLTNQPSVELRVPLLLGSPGDEGAPGGAPPTSVVFQATVTRELFEDLNADLFGKILAPVAAVLAEGHLTREEVDEVVLVGGSTRIPRIRALIGQYFGKEPNTSVDPDLAVVTGVAVQAGIVGGAWPLEVSAIEIPNRGLRKTNFD